MDIAKLRDRASLRPLRTLRLKAFWEWHNHNHCPAPPAEHTALHLPLLRHDPKSPLRSHRWPAAAEEALPQYRSDERSQPSLAQSLLLYFPGTFDGPEKYP